MILTTASLAVPDVAAAVTSCAARKSRIVPAPTKRTGAIDGSLLATTMLRSSAMPAK